MTHNKSHVKQSSPPTESGEKTTLTPSLAAVMEFGDSHAAFAAFGLKRPMLYQLKGAGLIKSASLKKPGQVKAKRLWVFSSIRDFLTSKIEEANQ